MVSMKNILYRFIENHTHSGIPRGDQTEFDPL